MRTGGPQYIPDRPDQSWSIDQVIKPTFVSVINLSGSDIAAGVPVEFDTAAAVTSYPRGFAVRAATGQGNVLGAPRVAIPNGEKGEIQVGGIQASVSVQGQVVAGDYLACMGDNYLTLDEHMLYVARGSIAAAAVRTLNATPVEAVAAPGAGLYAEPVDCKWFLDFGTAAYDAAAAGDTLGVKYTNGAGAQTLDTVAGNAIGAAAADYHVTVRRADEFIPVANAALVVHIDAGEWYAAAGDSVLRYELRYRKRTLDISGRTARTALVYRGPVARCLTTPSGNTATVEWLNPHRF